MPSTTPNAKIALVIAYEGYQPIEYSVPKKILSQAGYTIVTVSDAQGTATAKDGSTTEVDLVLSALKPADYAGIFFIGGPGALEHLDNKISYALLQKAIQLNIPCGAICVSPRIFAQAGILNGKKATGWDGDNELDAIFKKYGVIRIDQEVVVDGTIVTATGPQAAQAFAEEIIALLQDQKGW